MVILITMTVYLYLRSNSLKSKGRRCWTLSQYSTVARTGDLVLFSDPGSRTVRMGTRCVINHASFVIVNPRDRERILLYESDVLGHSMQTESTKDLITGAPKAGSILFTLRKKMAIRKPGGSIIVLRLRATSPAVRKSEEEDHSTMMEYVKHSHGWGFPMKDGFWIMQCLRSNSLLPVPARFRGGPRKETFCSELASLCLRAIGALNPAVEPVDVMPEDLWEDNGMRVLGPGWSFDEPIFLRL